MYVTVCFDVEDLVHPAADDVALDIAQRLAAEGVTASMMVVGEKARLWEWRERDDVIRWVGCHDVGLHTDSHSIHPTVAEYLADKGWADGVAEAVAREAPGVEDLARIVGRAPSTGATAGASWGPQIAAASRQLGLPSHTYSHVGTGRTGACWFAGQLCYPDHVSIAGGEDTLCDDGAFEAALPALLERVQEAERAGAACLGLFAAHPTRLRHEVFWDALNFADGENRAPNQYVEAGQRSDDVVRSGLRNLTRMVLAVGRLSGVDLVETRELTERFLPYAHALTDAEVMALAASYVASGEIGASDPLASPAQALDLLARALPLHAKAGELPPRLPLRDVIGPDRCAAPLPEAVSVDIDAALALCRDLASSVERSGRIPAGLRVGEVEVGAGPLLLGLARTLTEMGRGVAPDWAVFLPGAEAPAGAISLAEGAIDRRLPGWPPHRRDLRLDRLREQTLLQTWSLRPATIVD